MQVRGPLLLALFLAPALCHGETPPEALLSPRTQFYFRWDGITAHRQAYARSAAGKVLAGDLGRFLQDAFKQSQELLRSSLTAEKLLKGLPPEQLAVLQQRLASVPRLVSLLGDKGLIVAGEIRALKPFAGQLTLIIPNAGGETAALIQLVQLIAGANQVALQEKTIAGRKVLLWNGGDAHLAVWQESTHAFLMLGTEPPERLLDSKLFFAGPRFTDQRLWKELHAFNQFETVIRACVDAASLVRLCRSANKETARLVNDLGLDGLQNWTFIAGFEGEVEHRLTQFQVDGPRRGLFTIGTRQLFSLKDLPPLSPDADSWTALNLSLPAVFDVGVQALEDLQALSPPLTALASSSGEDSVKQALRELDNLLGVNVRRDLLDCFGSRLIVHSCPYEGLAVFGESLLIQVKDSARLQTTLDRIFRTIGNSTGGAVRVKRRSYHGAVLQELHPRQQGIPFVPTIAVHNGWLAIGAFPQPVRGYILRATGNLPGWRPDERTQAALARLPQWFVGVSVTDPRSWTRQYLAIAPFFAGFLNGAGGTETDLAILPNVPEINQHLFPNVSVVTDDGRTIRIETHASLAFPFDYGWSAFFVVFGVFSAF